MATTTRTPTTSPEDRTHARGAQLAPGELAAWRGFLRVHAALTKQLDAELAAVHGLPLRSYEVLLHLADAPEGRMRMSELAETVLLSRSGLTRLVDRLEREGLVCRESCPSDARGSNAIVTGAGRERLRTARATHLEGVRERFLDRFSAAEQRALAGYWERLAPGAAHGDEADGC
jgi:DNA-binding MarR family transcriptional regulator